MTARSLDAIAADVAAVSAAITDWLNLPRPDPAAGLGLRRDLTALRAECDQWGDQAALVRLHAQSADATLGSMLDMPQVTVQAFERVAEAGESLLATVPADSDDASDLVHLVMQAWVDAAVISMEMADLDGAEDRLDRAEQAGQVGVSPAAVVSWLNAGAALGLTRGRASEAYARAEAAYTMAAQWVPEDQMMITATGNLATACWQLGQCERARALAEQVLAHPQRNTSEDQAARTTIGLSWHQHDHHRAIDLLAEVATEQQATNDLYGYAETALMIGNICADAGHLPEAQAWLQAAAATTNKPTTAAASCLIFAQTLPSDDPQAQQLRQQARDLAAETTPSTRLLYEWLTAENSELPAQELLDSVLPLALVMDLWRLELPWGLGRGMWNDTPQAEALASALHRAADLGRIDLVAATVAHLCAISPRPEGFLVSPPPPVLLAGSDPLGDAATRALDYEFRVRANKPPIDLVPTAENVLEVMIAWRGEIYLCWRPGGASSWQTTVIAGADVHEPLERVLAGFDTDQHVLTDPAAERAVMEQLGRALLPPQLVADLPVCRGEDRGQVRIRVDGDLAGLCWGLLVVPGSDERLLQRADVVTLAPYGLSTGAAEPAVGGVVSVIDPTVPGVAIDSTLGSVLGAGASREAWQRRLEERADDERGHASSDQRRVYRNDQDRIWLAAALAKRPERLICLAHAGTVPIEGGYLVNEPAVFLSCRADLPGRAVAAISYRALTASDLLDPDLFDWFPPRVALVGCASGADARVRDSFGLTHALLSRGSTLVTALRWPVPTLQWYLDQGVANDSPAINPGVVDPLLELSFAVDSAHQGADPVAELGTWQRAALSRWLATGAVIDSPIGWGALHTIVRVY